MSGSKKRGARITKEPVAKRRKTNTFGAATEADDIPTPLAQATAPTASALSTRTLPAEHIQSLGTICARVFAENLQNLSRDPMVWDVVRGQLKQLPENLVPRLFAVLRQTCPTLLHHGLLVAYFLRGTSIALTSELPGVSNLTVTAIRDSPSKDILRELELTGFAKIADNTFATAVAKLPALRKLVLRGCLKVADKTVSAAAKHCSGLEILNLNYTAVLPVALAPVLLGCKNLKVLKVAGINNWTDASCAKLWAALHPESEAETSEEPRFPDIQTLKIRQAPLTDASINPILAACPNLLRLDLSFTHVKNVQLLECKHGLEKLSLTSTKVPMKHLLELLAELPKLKILLLGALGGGQGSSVPISNSTAMTLNDQTLRVMTDILAELPDLERVSLVANAKLGATASRANSALADFIRRVGRRCQDLNLAGVGGLRSSDLEGLLLDGGQADQHPRIQALNLNNTPVDDTAAPYISACSSLATLEVAGTKFTSAGLFPIIDACERLEKLDLTSCRGVSVGERRRFFEVWEQDWKNR